MLFFGNGISIIACIIACGALFVVTDAGKKEKVDPDANCDKAKGVDGVHSFGIKGNSPKGTIVQYNVLYNATRGLPISTTAYHDSMNHQSNVERLNDFRKYKCSQLASNKIQADCSKSYKMTSGQQAFSGKKSFDRGHITPANPFTYDADAVSKTFLCVNIAPQDPYTNQGPWRMAEHTVGNELTAGFVMTGICDDDSPEGRTEDDIPVPDCYWKLACYKEGSKTYVFGFIGNNTLIPKSDKFFKEERNSQTKTLRVTAVCKVLLLLYVRFKFKMIYFVNIGRSQAEVIERHGENGKSMIERGWKEAEKTLLDKREKDLAPKAKECIKAKKLDAKQAKKWNGNFLKTEKNDKPPKHADE